jgi:DNA-binding CsgD family transcriptional regulator
VSGPAHPPARRERVLFGVGRRAHDGGRMERVEARHRVALVGRGTELGILRAAVEGAARGRRRAVVVEGEAGIGKSRLLDEVLEDAAELGFRVLVGWCNEIERDRPLRALRAALEVDQHASDVTRAKLGPLLGVGSGPVDPAAPVVDMADEGWLIVESVVEVLEQFAATGPVVLVVEDLQWADPLTLRAVHAIGRQMTGLPFVLFVTLRGGGHDPDVSRVVADLLARGADHVRVDPLASEETAALAREVAGLPPGPGLLEQLSGTGGNPLFVIELVRALDDNGALDLRDGLAEARDVSLPPTLRLTLLRRLSLLSQDALNLLRVASILGSTFSLAELTLVTGTTAASLLSALTVAVDAGLLTESGNRLAFRHDLIRDAIYHDLPLAVRKGLHREVGAALGGAGAPIDQVAGHIALGAEPGDTEAVAWLQRAASAAATRSPATAVRLLERALELADPSDPARDTLASEVVQPLLASGRLQDAETLARDVLARGPEREIALLTHTSLAGVLSIGARYPEAIHQIEQAVTAASEQQRPSLVAAESLLMVLNGQVESGREAAQRAIDAAEPLGDDRALCLGLQTLAMLALADGFVHRAVALAHRAVGVDERAAITWAGLGVPHLWYGTALADADRFADAEVAFQTGLRRSEQTGNLTRLPLYHWGIAEMRLAAGRWDDAVAEAQAGLGLIEETANHVGDVFANALCAHVAFHRGELGLAHAAVREAERRLVAGPVEIGYEWMTWIGALLLEARGEAAEALSVLARTWDLIAPLRYLQATSRAMGPDLVRMALASGDRPRALSVTEELERVVARGPTPTARGLGLRCRGLLDDSPDCLLESVAAHRSGPRPYQLAAACEDAGIALKRAARPNEAVSLLTDAADAYEQLGAVRDVARVLAVLRTLGIRRGRHAPRRPSFGWESLTPSELRVVGLAAEGLTNGQIAERLFVSRRTVATHLEHVFQKLGHANRVELAAEATRRATTDPTSPRVPTTPEAAQASPGTPPPAAQ